MVFDDNKERHMQASEKVNPRNCGEHRCCNWRCLFALASDTKNLHSAS